MRLSAEAPRLRMATPTVSPVWFFKDEKTERGEKVTLVQGNRSLPLNTWAILTNVGPKVKMPLTAGLPPAVFCTSVKPSGSDQEHSC